MTIQETKVQKNKKQLLKYIFKNKSFNIGNRELAIRKSIQNAEPNEIILIAEKVMRKNKFIKIK